MIIYVDTQLQDSKQFANTVKVKLKPEEHFA